MYLECFITICILSEHQLNYMSRRSWLCLLQSFRISDNNKSALCSECRGRGACGAEGGADWHTTVHAAGDGTDAERGHDAGADTGCPCPTGTSRHTDGTGLCGYQCHAKHHCGISASDSRADNHPSDTVYKTGEIYKGLVLIPRVTT